MRLYQYFQNGIPWYLARHYWWAYLWSVSVSFFDHQTIINAILFGQYNRLMRVTLNRVKEAPQSQVLQLTSVYGSLTPTLVDTIAPNPIHLMDAAQIQLDHTAAKVPDQNKLLLCRMNAEYLAYKNDAFSLIILFFLLHEMPPEARKNVYNESIRTLKSGGQIIITEYGHLPKHHFLYRVPIFRWILTKLEPFLESFWQEDVEKHLSHAAKGNNKEIAMISQTDIFNGFYRVMTFQVK